MATLNEGHRFIRNTKTLLIILSGTVATAAIVSLLNLQTNITANQKRLEQDIKLQKILDERKREEIKQNQETIKKDLEKQIEALKAQAEAKKAQTLANAAKAAQNVATRVVPHAQASGVSGTKADWLRASGIPESQWGYVDSIVTRESGWNPNAVNKSSGACGLGQQLPCGKWAGAWNDPVAALKAMNGYVTARYGGWAGAVAFWNRNHWY